MINNKQDHRRRRTRAWLWAAVAAAGAVTALLIALAAAIPFSSETARSELVDVLAERLASDVQLDSLTLKVLPRLRAQGAALTVRHEGRTDVPPLISISQFSVESGPFDVLRRHISHVAVQGLEIQIPPGEGDEVEDDDEDIPRGDFVIDRLAASNAKLVIIPRTRDKQPKVWTIHDLALESVGFDRRMPFDAKLTNAVPPGEIATRGTFGPWGSIEPGRTPVEGSFTFDKADLSVFKGIAGILSAAGTFRGRLNRIEVEGDTNTPQFTLSSVGHPVPLRARYHTIVDGTNGDTVLERIDAAFLETALVAQGEVVDDTPGEPGRRVRLDVTMERARIEDVLWLAVKTAEPPMTGALTLQTTMEIPPGDQDVVEKLELDGKFSMTATRFTNIDIQQRIEELSRRSRGRPGAGPSANVTSDFTGSFKLADAVLTIPAVAFDVPGAVVRLSGTYGLTSEVMDFRGTLFMDAKLSQTVTGFKSLLLKVIDPLFRGENGGSAIPIRISGQRSNPSFGIDKGRIFRRD